MELGQLESILGFIKPLLEMIGGDGAILLGKAIVYVGLARLVIKPLVVIVQNVVLATENKDDDKWFEKVKKPAEWIYFILDWLASIKVKK